MRTLIKNPSKVLIILERSKGEKSIPEMDKVLDTFKIRVREKGGLGKIHILSRFLLLQTSLSFHDYKIPGEVVGPSQDDSDGAGKAAQAKAQVGSTLGHFNHGEIFSCLRKKNLKFHL